GEGPPGGTLRPGRGERLSHLPKGRGDGLKPDGGGHGDPLRSLVERGGPEPGHGPGLPHRPGAEGDGDQADHEGHGGGEDTAAAGDEAEPGGGRHRPGNHRARLPDGAGCAAAAGGVEKWHPWKRYITNPCRSGRRTEYRILFTERTTGPGSDVIITKNVREK